MIAPSIRQGLIADQLIEAVQQGQLTQKERDSVMWCLRAWKWQLPAGMPAELQQRVIAICPLLASEPTEEAPEAEPAAIPTPAPRAQAVREPRKATGILSHDFGLTPPTPIDFEEID